jgi:hypothetical protein
MDLRAVNSDGTRVSNKKCEFCGDPAHYSIAFVLSTLGIRPRRQKCSSVILICDDCIQTLYESDPQIPEELQNALKRAYTTLKSVPTAHAERSETAL